MKKKLKDAFMDIAFRFAECSTARRLKVGAICVKHNRIISIGYNGTPKGWDNNCEDEGENGELTTKKCVIHAESNCLMKLAQSLGGAKNSRMFITHSPCYECAKLIYQAGVKKVYYSKTYRSLDGVLFLKKCGIIVKRI